MADAITSFTGPHAFLSNFYPVQVMLDGIDYPSVEHAYQAAKTVWADERMRVRKCVRAVDAKRMGKRVTMRPDWEQVKLQVMEDLLRQKFKGHEHLRKWLSDTGAVQIIEGNWWGDTFWGVCKGKGTNHLGRLLMEVRDHVRGSVDK